MNIETLSELIPQLNNPLMLAGFVLCVLAGLGLLFKGLSGAATERLLNRLMMACLALGLLAIVLGFASDMQKQAAQPGVVQSVEGVKDSSVAQAGCNAVASAHGAAQQQGGTNSATQGVQQSAKNVEGSVVAQGGCNAATSQQDAKP